LITLARREQCRVNTARWRASKPAAPGVMAAKLAAWVAANPEKALLQNARRRARRKGIPFDLVYTDLVPLPTHCPVLGMRLAYGPGRGRKLYENPNAASLDRIHNHLGYVKGNVIVISLRANLLKGQATVAELRKIADFYGRLP
jgi:hypothetical protein